MKEEKAITRYPNLKSIIMVENFLESRKSPVKIPDIKKGIPKKIMHQTLQVILNYLWESKKIEFTPKGVVWIFEKRGA